MSSIDRLKMCKRYFIIVVDGISDMNDISTYHQFVLIFFSLARESQLHLTIGLFEIVCLIFQVSIFVFFFFFGNYFHCLNFICRIYLVFVIRSSSAFSEFMRFDYLFVLLVSHLIEAM